MNASFICPPLHSRNQNKNTPRAPSHTMTGPATMDVDAGGAGAGPATAVATAAAGPKDGYELPWVREKRRRRAGGDASARRERVAPFF